eukprot:2584232-Rhodomonas_salina.1
MVAGKGRAPPEGTRTRQEEERPPRTEKEHMKQPCGARRLRRKRERQVEGRGATLRKDGEEGQVWGTSV